MQTYINAFLDPVAQCIMTIFKCDMLSSLLKAVAAAAIHLCWCNCKWNILCAWHYCVTPCTQLQGFQWWL